jgi:hypothetical protein
MIAFKFESQNGYDVVACRVINHRSFDTNNVESTIRTLFEVERGGYQALVTTEAWDAISKDWRVFWLYQPR